MVVNLSNIGVAVGDSKNRVILFIIFIAVSFAIGLGIYEFKHRVNTGVPSATTLTGAPKVESIPGVGTPSREYVKLQQEQNVQQVQQAERTGTSAVPTIVRESYIGTDDLAGGADNSAASAKAKGCDVESLRRAKQAGVSAFELRCRGCDAAALRAAGYTAGELRAAGFSARDLRKAGFNPAELRAAGHTASELRQAGFSPTSLRAIGFTSDQLKAAGFTPEDEGKACDINSLTQAHRQGISASVLKQRGCDAAALKAAGYTAKELKAAGYTTDDLGGAGYTATQLKAAGFSCDVETLKRARAKGALAADLRKQGCGAAALKAAGYTAGELRDAGFSAAELKNAGFSAAALKAAGFSEEQLKDAGFSARQLRDAGFTAGQLKKAGFTGGELSRGGFAADRLKAAGFTASELRRAGYGASALEAADFNPEQLKEAGYTQGELIRAGVPVSQASATPAAADTKQPAASGESEPASGADTDKATPDQSSADAQLERLRQRQAEQLSEQESKANLQALEESMSSNATSLIGTWAPPPIQNYIEGEPPSANETAAGSASGGNATVNGTPGQGAQNNFPGSNNETIKAGTVMFAVLDTSISTDEPSPVLATIVQGKLKGAKLIGEFKHPNARAGRVLVTFNRMSLPHMTRSITMNAVALDANTAHTAIADYVNHHYGLRYGTLIASSILKGIGEAVVKSGSTSNFSQFGVQVSHEKLSQEQLLLAGLGEAGSQYAQSLRSNFTTPTTVRVFAGTSIGVLFTQDLMIPAILSDKN